MRTQNNGQYLVVVLIVATLHACTSRQVYDGLQARQQVLCQEVPRSEYQKCMDEASQSYDAYKRERDELEQAE